MTESNDGGKKGLTRRDFGKAAGVAVVSAGLAALAGCLPQDKKLVEGIGAVVRETTDARATQKQKDADWEVSEEVKLKAEAVEKAKKQTEVVPKTSEITPEQRLEMERRRLDLGMALKGEFERLGENPQILEWVSFTNLNNPLYGKIASPRGNNRGSYLRGLPLSTRGDTMILPLTIITAEKRNKQNTFAKPVERIQFSISLTLSGGYKQVWAAVESKDLKYSNIEIPDNAKTLSAGDRNYVFFCKEDRDQILFDFI